MVDAIIIGGGACGLMCAVQAGFLGKKTVILEKNEKPGAKILISGGGRCNFTNLHTSAINFLSDNEHFCKSAFSQWSVNDTVQFFETYGIRGQEKTLGQIFPIRNKAKDIVEVFTRLCGQLQQDIRCRSEVMSVKKNPEGFFEIEYRQNSVIHHLVAPKVVLASGGLPIQKLGSSDFALRVARQFGLRITQTAPALVPLTVTGKDAGWFSQLSGNSIFCRVSNSRISFEENILFTHWGLSGPAILQISSYWRPGESITIDLLPGRSVTQLIEEEKVRNGRKSVLSLLSSIFSKKFAEALGKYLPINKNLASLSKEDLGSIDRWIHHFEVKPAGDKGYDRAEVMRGGVDTNELSSKTLEAKKVPGLYFGGECMDVTGWLGGYNFQWAWACGYVIAKNL